MTDLAAYIHGFTNASEWRGKFMNLEDYDGIYKLSGELLEAVRTGQVLEVVNEYNPLAPRPGTVMELDDD